MCDQDNPASTSSTTTLLDSRVHLSQLCLTGETAGLKVLVQGEAVVETVIRSMAGVSAATRVEVFEASILVVDNVRSGSRVYVGEKQWRSRRCEIRCKVREAL
jgi:hypothetical protein